MDYHYKDSEFIKTLDEIQEEIKENKRELNRWKKSVLFNWIETHQANPYPTEKQKLALALKLGMSKNQIENWFVNTRKVRIQIFTCAKPLTYGECPSF